MDWYYVRNGERVGPLNDRQFSECVASGEVTAETLVWHEGMADWAPYEQVRTAEPTEDMPSRDVVCSECGRTFPRDETVMIEGVPVCAECKPRALQKLQEGVTLGGTWRYGGFWIRGGAKIVDGIITSIAGAAVKMGVSLLLVGAVSPEAVRGETAFGLIFFINFVVPTVVGASYTTFFLGRFAATPGKMVFGLRVIRADGERVSYLRALGRHFAEMLSSAILGIGYLMAAFDEEKRTLHDRICGTRVIYR